MAAPAPSPRDEVARVVATAIEDEIAACQNAARHLPGLTDCLIQDEVAQRLRAVERRVLDEINPAH